VELEQDMALVIRNKGLDLRPVLAVALAQIDAGSDLIGVIRRDAVAVGVAKGLDRFFSAVTK